MDKSIKIVFNELSAHVKIDKKLLKRISRYVNGFVTKNSDSISFFGDTLLGVYPVKFTPNDRNEWFDDVLEVDDIQLKREIHSLPDIEPKFFVSSDVTNLSYVWLAHRIITNNSLNKRDKAKGAINVISMMHFKFITSLMAHNFKYPADKTIALATYASLSKKFSLKVYGSWAKLVTARAESILDKKSLHIETLQKFDNDEAIIKMVNDIQGRIREVVKKMMEVFYRIREEDARISVSSSVINIDGDTIVKDKISKFIKFRKHLHTIITDRNSFIKKELVAIIISAMHTLPEKNLLEALTYMTDNYKVRGDVDISDLLDISVIHAFNFLNSNKIAVNDLVTVITKLRAIYLSSRSNEVDIVEVRDTASRIITESISSKNAAIHASVRTGVILYTVLRALTMKHYTD